MNRLLQRVWVVVLLSLFTSGVLHAQATQQPPQTFLFDRSVSIDEFTGTWCGYCPFGAYALDSMMERMGNRLVVCSFHDQDEVSIQPVHDTLAKDRALDGWPEASIDGGDKQGTGITWNTSHPWYMQARNDSSVRTPVDMKIVNLKYDDGGHSVDFDLEITPVLKINAPLHVNSMRLLSEDSQWVYYTRAVVTEDGLHYSQHLYIDGNTSNATDLPDFIHYNVVRKIGGKVLGDKFNLGTKGDVTSYPIRRHYHIPITASWDPSKLRIKAELGVRTSKANYRGAIQYNAAQSDYLSKYTTEMPKQAAVLLPSPGDILTADSTNDIIWTTNGAGNPVKLEYQVSGTTTWKEIIASTTASPYHWKPAADAYDADLKIRVTDLTTNLSGTSGEFHLEAPTPALITIVDPSPGVEVMAGSTTRIKFNISGPVAAKRRIDFSKDGGVTWDSLADASSLKSLNEGGFKNYYYDWKVPTETTDKAAIRVIDANGAYGKSNFVISIKKGTLSVVVQGVSNGAIYVDQPVTFNYNWKDGAPADTVTFSVSVNGTTWAKLNTLANGETSVSYTPKAAYVGKKMYFRLEYNGGNVDEGPYDVLEADGVEMPGTPMSYMLEQNYPNPFNPTTQVRYGVQEHSTVFFTVHDLLGREVMRTLAETKEAGSYLQTFDCSQLASGTYIYKLHAGEHILTGKMTLNK